MVNITVSDVVREFEAQQTQLLELLAKIKQRKKDERRRAKLEEKRRQKEEQAAERAAARAEAGDEADEGEEEGAEDQAAQEEEEEPEEPEEEEVEDDDEETEKIKVLNACAYVSQCGVVGELVSGAGGAGGGSTPRATSPKRGWRSSSLHMVWIRHKGEERYATQTTVHKRVKQTKTKLANGP